MSDERNKISKSSESEKMGKPHVLLIIDNKERALLGLWKNLKDIPYEIACSPLTAGDFWICKSDTPMYIPKEHLVFGFDQEGRPECPWPPSATDIVIERKAREDLHSSMSDGRYEEQKRRLMDFEAVHKVLLMEGFHTPLPAKEKSKRKRELSVCTNSQFRDDFQVYHTTNVQGSFEYINHVCEQMAKGKFEEKERQKKRGKYSEVVKMEKKANITPTNILAIQIGQIPGLSAKMGQAVAELYPSMYELCQAFAASSEPRKLLEDIKVDGKRLATRAGKVYDFLFAQDQMVLTPMR